MTVMQRLFLRKCMQPQHAKAGRPWRTCSAPRVVVHPPAGVEKPPGEPDMHWVLGAPKKPVLLQ
jgi:hypothetical protein